MPLLAVGNGVRGTASPFFLEVAGRPASRACGMIANQVHWLARQPRGSEVVTSVGPGRRT